MTLCFSWELKKTRFLHFCSRHCTQAGIKVADVNELIAKLKADGLISA